MPQRCSSCGSWQDSADRSCERCGERLRGNPSGLRRIIRVTLVVAGAVLIGLNLRPVLEPLIDSQVVTSVPEALAFLAGVIAIVIGFVWR